MRAPVTPRAARLGDWVSEVVHTGAEGALRGGIDQLVRRNLRGVWVTGEIPAGACVWAANHHSWWDFFVAAAALRATGRRDVGVLMDAGNVGRPGLFQQVGVVGTDQLRTAVQMLRDGMALVVFPEGELRPFGAVGQVHRGARWLADRSGAQLRAVGTRVVMRGQQAPEAYLQVSGALGPDVDLARALGDSVVGLDALLAGADPAEPLPGFRPVVTGVRSWNERFGALRGGR
ncbi:MAG: 1-acyl-sn-glycerol-3-phosphate acyltransferase [Nakamurella sp.]